jgi:DNA-binding transcriptional LysR family regulator
MNLLRDIALFVEVVNTKSFSRAATNLGMPPSTLSRRISGLEQEIGLRLFNRTTRKVEVTEAGAAYFGRCAHLVDEARVAHEDLAETVNVGRGTLRLSCTADFACVYLPDILTDFTRMYPAINVDLDLSSRFVDLISEGLDAALRIGELSDSALVARRIGSLHLGLYASPLYLKQAPDLSSPQDLSNHVCIRLNSTERGSVWQLHHVDKKRARTPAGAPDSVKVDGRFSVSSVFMIRELTLRGAGVGVIDRRLAASSVESGRLVHVLPQWCLAPAPLHLLTPSRLMPARVRLFREFLVERLREPKPAPMEAGLSSSC